MTTGGRSSWPPLPVRPRRRAVRPWAAIRTPLRASARWTLMAVSLAVVLLAWIALSGSGLVSPTFLPSPAAVLDAGLEMSRSGTLWTDLLATSRRVLCGFGLAVLVSVPLGVLMGTFDAARAVLEPLTGLLRYLPASAFVVLLIIWLGIGEASKVALLFLGTVFFNTLMTADAVRLVPRAMIDVSYTLGARRGEVVRKVVLPHALPGIVDAIRVNAAAAWNFVVVAELVNSDEGLGYRIIRSQRFLQTDRIFAVLVVIGVVGLAIDALLRLLRLRVGRWTA